VRSSEKQRSLRISDANVDVGAPAVHVVHMCGHHTLSPRFRRHEYDVIAD
jgi:hypothetical protein